MNKELQLLLPLSLLRRIIRTLEEAAHDKAGISQSPYLIRYTDTQEHRDALFLRKLLKLHKERENEQSKHQS